MTARDLLLWSALHAQRERSAHWWRTPGLGIAIAAACAVGWVLWRDQLASDPRLTSRAWLLAALAIYGVNFLRVPFEIYWRRDSALLAQLPIPSAALVDVALIRCARAAFGSTVVAVIAATPLLPYDLFERHLAIIGLFAVASAAFVPAVVIWAASIVAMDETQTKGHAGAMLGGIPGGLGAIIIVVVLLAAPWLTGGEPALPIIGIAAGIVAGSAIALVAARKLGGRAMSQILRETAALDRQRLAALEIREPTALEKLFATLAGAGALVYRKDAQLVRRRYPLAFALGALAFLALIIIGFVGPEDSLLYIAIAVGIPTTYAGIMASRLNRPPIELPRLLATLPIAPAAATRARIVWLVGYWSVFVGAPAALALVVR